MTLAKGGAFELSLGATTPRSPPDTLPRPFDPLVIGPVRIEFPIVQAALSGYSDWAMRIMARRFGAQYALCEVMLDEFLVVVKDQRRKNRHFLYLSDDDHPVGGQLMGAEPEQFAQGATRLVEAGFDIIDINFGCPVKKVLGRCRGGFHLSQPAVALEIVRRTRERVPPHIPVTVKMRRGIDDSSESRDNFFTILEGAIGAGVAAFTIHGRTVAQRYIGPSRWSFLSEVRNLVGSKPVALLGSGDLFTPEACLNMMSETGVHGVTVARGAIGNPWIFSQARALAAGSTPSPPDLHEQRDVLLDHFALSEELYGAEHCGKLMRKVGIKYAALHPHYLDVREAFTHIRQRSDWEAVLAKHYAINLPGKFPGPEIHKAQGSCEEG